MVAGRLCSYGHTLAEVRSIYRWRGQVHDRPEARATPRTRRALVPQIVERANREHPYEVPPVVAVPLIDGNPAHLRRILNETKTS